MRTILVPLNVDAAMPPGGSISRADQVVPIDVPDVVNSVLPPGADGAVVTRALQGELDEIVAQMSHWDEGSLLSRYNRAPAGSWHALPPQFFAVAEYALQVAADSGGAYDPAAGALVDLWGFGARGRYDQPGFQAPQAGLVDKFLAHRVKRRPVLDHAGRRLLQPGGAILDFSSVAKGYAVDRMAACLEERSVRHFVVEAGGELRGAGVKPDGQPWWVEVEGVPDCAAVGQTIVALHGLAIATSGDYRRSFQYGMRRMAHTLDPRSGYPVDHDLASVTVLASTCMAADALSTALTVLGPDDGLAFAEQRGIAARFLVRAGSGLKETTTGAWRLMLQ